MMFIIKVVIFVFTVTFINSHTLDYDHCACMIIYFKAKRWLSNDFPTLETSNRCWFINTLVNNCEYQNFERLNDKTSINVECTKRKLKLRNIIIYILIKEVLETTPEIVEDKKVEILDNNRKFLIKMLNNIARECKSDETWAGLFDDIFKVEATTLAAAIEEQDEK
ncbi:hypothetical protein PVAND_005405 [Polypedilum vanderplanki]|uniref:Uncharacterized protein n=1 Tax=Polypedilum vanderplanki TaxID=319348 RepID=A0A9J6C0Y5_POLVA|nr:hypothetical protein PVAND_005405 [Polypedilum vanderplanki]